MPFVFTSHRSPERAHARSTRAFTLVELLVVIGIIALLIGLLMPSLTKARAQALSVKCMSNMRQVGMELAAYANTNRGAPFPPGRGSGLPRDERWPVMVFSPPVWNPPVMTCPADDEPVEEHSYLLNSYLTAYKVKFNTTRINRLTAPEIIVMGEKKTSEDHYYMDPEAGDYATVVEFWQHGKKLGSNYLYLDLHVETSAQLEAKVGIDPWAVAQGPPPARP